MWDKKLVEKLDICIGGHSVSLLFRNVEDVFNWMFLGVYGPNEDNLRGGLCGDLSSVNESGMWLGV